MLLPSLIDRLTDDHPDQEMGPPRALSRAGLGERVRSELAHLLNAANLDCARNLDDFPHVASTGINFGIRDLTGCTRSSVSTRALETTLKHAIERYEPRLCSRTLSVSCSSLNHRAGTPSLRIRIEGELRGSSVPERLRFSTVLNLEDGEVRVEPDAAPSRLSAATQA